MSDALITIIAVGVIAAIQSLITAWTSRKAAAQNAEIIAAAAILASQLEKTDKKIEDTNKKVDEYHKETNSKLTQLVVAEKGVSYAEGKEQGRSEQQAKEPTPEEIKPTTVEGKGIKKDLTQAKEKIDQAKKKLDEI